MSADADLSFRGDPEIAPLEVSRPPEPGELRPFARAVIESALQFNNVTEEDQRMGAVV